jgi:hypothetical protein
MKRLLLILALALSAFADSPLPWLGSAVTTAASVKAAPGSLYGYIIGNPNASACYLQVFNATSVTLGTTTPVLSIQLTASGGANVSFPPIAFGTGIMVAATQTATGSTTCTTGLTVNLLYL